jgi:hypothetical protein
MMAPINRMNFSTEEQQIRKLKGYKTLLDGVALAA